MLNYERDDSDYYYGHLARYFDINKGYFSFYDLTVYIIVGTFLAVFIYTVFIQIQEKEKGYMFILVFHFVLISMHLRHCFLLQIIHFYTVKIC